MPPYHHYTILPHYYHTKPPQHHRTTTPPHHYHTTLHFYQHHITTTLNHHSTTITALLHHYHTITTKPHHYHYHTTTTTNTSPFKFKLPHICSHTFRTLILYVLIIASPYDIQTIAIQICVNTQYFNFRHVKLDELFTTNCKQFFYTIHMYKREIYATIKCGVW